jgi:hypothetical protein
VYLAEPRQEVRVDVRRRRLDERAEVRIGVDMPLAQKTPGTRQERGFGDVSAKMSQPGEVGERARQRG